MSGEARATRVGIVGGGHNGLVAAAYLARAGMDVTVLERLDHVGGAAISERPWEGLDARLSRYSYLVSLLPEEVVRDLGLDLELRSRPTASYTPYVDESGPAGLFVETDEGEATRASFRRRTGGDDEHAAWTAFYDAVGTLGRRLAPTFTRPLPRRSDVRADVDPDAWQDVVEQPLGVAIERRFADDLVRGVVGTDALIGTFASLHDTSLVQNRCFLYHLVGNGTGEWRVPVGGMGAVTAELERAAREAGATVLTDVEVLAVRPRDDGAVVEWAGGSLDVDWVLSNVSPWTLDGLTGTPREASAKPAGSQLKVNLLVSRLPALASGDDPRDAFAGTFHVGESYLELEGAWLRAEGGNLPPASGELYCHTLTDRSILGPELAASDAQTLTWFGLHLPHDVLLAQGAADVALARMLDALDAHLAEPIAPLLLGVEVKTPADVEADLGMPGGHIFHGDLAWPWLEDDEEAASPATRWGVATRHPRVLVCGSGARRGGAVSGIGGHNAAHALLDFIAAGEPANVSPRVLGTQGAISSIGRAADS